MLEVIYLLVRHENDYGDLDFKAYSDWVDAIQAAKAMCKDEADYEMVEYDPRPEMGIRFRAQSACTYLDIYVTTVKVNK